MRIPFYNLKGKVKLERERLSNPLDTLLDLIKISEDNDKKVKTLIISHSVYQELLTIKFLSFKDGKVLGYKFKVIPDVAVIWEK